VTLVCLGLERAGAAVVDSPVFRTLAGMDRHGFKFRANPELQALQIILHKSEEVLEATLELDGATDFQQVTVAFFVTEFEQPMFFADESQTATEGVEAVWKGLFCHEVG
jgi:hypothetical protein